MDNKKFNTGLIVTIVVFVMIILFGGTLFVLSSMGYVTFGKEDVKREENDDVELNLGNYLGYWYESEQHSTAKNSNTLNIKNVDDNIILMDLYVTRTASFDNFEVVIDGNSGMFEAIADTGPSSDGEIAKISGSVTVSDDSIKFVIVSSNVLYLENGSEYTFKYHIKNDDISGYKGVWYESEQHSTDKNSSTLDIKKIDNNQIIFDLYITRIANFDDVVVYISDNYGTFEATTDNGPSSDGNPSKISGYVKLVDDNIQLSVNFSNVLYLDNGTNYTFSYKK